MRLPFFGKVPYRVEMTKQASIDQALSDIEGAEEMLWAQHGSISMNAKAIATDLQEEFTEYFHSGRPPFRPKASEAVRNVSFTVEDLERYEASLFGGLFVRELRDGKNASNIVACLMVVPSNFSLIGRNSRDEPSFVQSFN
jgi:hypothetical protein